MSWYDPRAIFCYCYLVIVGFLAIAIALGEVRQESSFGLQPLIVMLAGMGPEVVRTINKIGSKPE